MKAVQVRCSCGAKYDPDKRCPNCTREDDQRRGSAHSRGYTHRWQKAARQHLDQNPLCVDCLARGRTTAATEVDHITPHRGSQSLFWNPRNWQSLCKRCHSRKTARGE